LLRALTTIVSLFLIGCGNHQEIDLERYQTPKANLDSLFSVGDSVLANFYIEQARQRLHQDSLSVSLSDYEIKLQQKQVREERERIIYKDTIVYRKKVKIVIDTLYEKVYITDTIRDTVRVLVEKRRKKRRGNQD